MIGQIDDSFSATMPTGGREKSAVTRKARVIGDPPQPHRSSEHAVLDAIKHLLNNARAGFSREVGNRRFTLQGALRFAQPAMRLLGLAEHALCLRGDARE